MIDMVIAALVERSTNRVLDAILRTDDARVQALQGIDRKVTDLRQGPFYAGVRFLAEANKPHRDDEGRRQDLLAARTAFFNALGNERSSPARMGLVTAYLALTHFVLGSYLDTEAFLEESHEHFWRAYVPPKPRSGVLAGMIGSAPLDTTLLPYLDWITGLRVGLGAHPRSVPRIVIATAHGLPVSGAGRSSGGS